MQLLIVIVLLLVVAGLVYYGLAKIVLVIALVFIGVFFAAAAISAFFQKPKSKVLPGLDLARKTLEAAQASEKEKAESEAHERLKTPSASTVRDWETQQRATLGKPPAEPDTIDPPTTGVEVTGWSKAESTAEPPTNFDEELKQLRRMAGLDK